VAIATPSSLANGEVTGDAACTSASFTPTAYITMFAQGVIRLSGGTAPAAGAMTDSEGGTWTSLFDVPVTGANSLRHQLFSRTASASPVSMTVTFTPPSGVTCSSVHVSSIAGITSDFTNSASDTDTAGDPSVILPSSPASTDMPMAWFGGVNTSTLTVPTDYTSLYSDTIPTLMRYGSHRFTGTPPAGTTITWTTATGASVGIVIAFKAQPDTTGTGAGTMAPLTGAASGVHGVAGTGAGSIQALAGAATAVHGVAGTAAGLIAVLTGAASGVHGVAGTGAGLIAALVGAASGTAGDGDTGYLPVHRPLIANPGSLLRRC
jgi:hypothetical protein